ncbi:acyl-CoA dehydrogenase family protein [Embleya sp. AB8]|uniref:acyl-CoA dehydrogenase family protein n=1 Tax=Embleya sp. AB8 TaxID=3156304 RepID=UPI003C76AD32
MSEDQRDLRAGVREFCEGRFGRERMRVLVDGAPGVARVPGMVDRGLWRELADTGFFALRVAEEAGGVGLGVAEAALVYEEAGRVLLPGPLVATHLAASLPAAVGAAAASGDAVVGLVEGDSWPLLVEHLDALDWLLVLTGEGVRLVDPAEVRGERVAHPVDPFTPVTAVDELPVGELVADALVAEQWRRIGAVLTGALQLGIAGRLTELATHYAKEREQFGRVIGGFQAVKHLCAEMLVRTEIARAAVYAAAVTLDDPAVGDAEVAVLTAKVMGDDAATRNGKDATQVHGGMGFTWEVDVHLFLKRAWVHSTQFGFAEENEEALAGSL